MFSTLPNLVLCGHRFCFFSCSLSLSLSLLLPIRPLFMILITVLAILRRRFEASTGSTSRLDRSRTATILLNRVCCARPRWTRAGHSLSFRHISYASTMNFRIKPSSAQIVMLQCLHWIITVPPLLEPKSAFFRSLKKKGRQKKQINQFHFKTRVSLVCVTWHKVAVVRIIVSR